MNTDEGRKQREAAKAKYLESLTKAKSNDGDFKKNSIDFSPNKWVHYSNCSVKIWIFCVYQILCEIILG